MMKDRAYALLNTEMFAPRYLHLSISNTRALEIRGGEILASANYTLVETRVEEAKQNPTSRKISRHFRIRGQATSFERTHLYLRQRNGG